MLTDNKIKAAKPQDKVYKLFDFEGLYLEVPPTGKKRWRLKYRHEGKEKRISLGVYPDVSLREAREKKDEARKNIAAGRDPSELRKSSKRQDGAASGDTFRAVAEEWIGNRIAGWSERHVMTMRQRLEAYIYPYIGDTPIQQIKPLDVLTALRVVERRGAVEAARKTLGICSLICRYGVASARIASDPCRDLRGALQVRKPGHFAAITDKDQARQLMRAIDGYGGSPFVRLGLLFLAHTFVRPGNIRNARWENIDGDMWVIPAKEMKGRREHIVPLSRQAQEILEELKSLRLKGEEYIFPSIRPRGDRRMSENALNYGLRALGYGGEQMTAHGFRSMASSILNEMGQFPPDVIERQLAHVDGNKIRGVYNRAEYLEQRKLMMQTWSNFLCQPEPTPLK